MNKKNMIFLLIAGLMILVGNVVSMENKDKQRFLIDRLPNDCIRYSCEFLPHQDLQSFELASRDFYTLGKNVLGCRAVYIRPKNAKKACEWIKKHADCKFDITANCDDLVLNEIAQLKNVRSIKIVQIEREHGCKYMQEFLDSKNLGMSLEVLKIDCLMPHELLKKIPQNFKKLCALSVRVGNDEGISALVGSDTFCWNLESLKIRSEYITDKALTTIAENFRNLNSLTLRSCEEITGKGLAKISCLKRLCINDCENFDPEALRDLKELKTLRIKDSEKFTGNELEKMSNLTKLYVVRCPRFNQLNGLSGLQSFRLYKCDGFIGDGLAALGALRNFSIRGCKKFDAKYLKKLPKLVILEIIEQSDFTGDEFEFLKELTAVSVVCNSKAKFKSSTLAKLRKVKKIKIYDCLDLKGSEFADLSDLVDLVIHYHGADVAKFDAKKVSCVKSTHVTYDDSAWEEIKYYWFFKI